MDSVKKILNDPFAGITSANKLWLATKKAGIRVKKKDVVELYKQSRETLAKPKNKPQMKTHCPFGTVGCLMADLVDVTRYTTKNSAIKFILNIIDIESRFVWSFPLANKKAATVAPPIRKVIAEIRHQYPLSMITFATDEGNEFKGPVSTMLKRNNVHHITTVEKNNQALIERFNKTLWELFRNYLQITGKLDFVNHLQLFVNKYNSTVNRSTGSTPNSIYKKKQLPKKMMIDYEIKCQGQRCQIINTRKEFTKNFKIGDLVRIANKTGRFDKKSIGFKWSEIAYEIVGQVHNRFQVKNSQSGNVLKKLYLPRELAHTNGINTASTDQNIADIKRVSSTTRRQRREAAFSDRDHSIDDFGNITITEKNHIPARSKRGRVPKKYFEIEGRGLVDGIVFY